MLEIWELSLVMMVAIIREGLLTPTTYMSFFHPSHGVEPEYITFYISFRFAELTAVAFINKGIRVYLFSQICPTPFVPFAVKLHKSCCGIMVTASHNPKDDNGYKVYWSNGAQVLIDS